MRRGVSEFIEWFPRIMLTLVALLIIVGLVEYYVHRDVDTGNVGAATMLYRIYYDPALIAYVDQQTQRAYPGVIDRARFQSVELDARFSPGTLVDGFGARAARLTLTPGEECTTASPIVRYVQQSTFDRYHPFAARKIRGPGGASMLEETFPVTILESGTPCTGRLQITVVERAS